MEIPGRALPGLCVDPPDGPSAQPLKSQRFLGHELSEQSRLVHNDAHFVELAMPVRAKWPPWIGVLATPSEAASAADAGRPFHPLILTSSRCVAGPMAG